MPGVPPSIGRRPAAPGLGRRPRYRSPRRLRHEPRAGRVGRICPRSASPRHRCLTSRQHSPDGRRSDFDLAGRRRAIRRDACRGRSPWTQPRGRHRARRRLDVAASRSALLRPACAAATRRALPREHPRRGRRLGAVAGGGASRTIRSADRFGSELTIAVATGGKLVDLEPVWELTPYFVRDPGRPVEALVGLAASFDLLVVGSRGLHGVAALGSVSERVAHRAPCSVLVVRQPAPSI